MKKKHWLIISIALILVLIGTVGVKKMTEPKLTEKERQIVFLKEHKVAMDNYIKKTESDNISKIDYEWNSVKTDKGMAFTKSFLTIKVNIYDKNEHKLNGFWINVFVDDVRNPQKIDRIN